MFGSARTRDANHDPGSANPAIAAPVPAETASTSPSRLQRLRPPVGEELQDQLAVPQQEQRAGDAVFQAQLAKPLPELPIEPRHRFYVEKARQPRRKIDGDDDEQLSAGEEAVGPVLGGGRSCAGRS